MLERIVVRYIYKNINKFDLVYENYTHEHYGTVKSKIYLKNGFYGLCDVYVEANSSKGTVYITFNLYGFDYEISCKEYSGDSHSVIYEHCRKKLYDLLNSVVSEISIPKTLVSNSHAFDVTHNKLVYRLYVNLDCISGNGNKYSMYSITKAFCAKYEGIDGLTIGTYSNDLTILL